MFCKTKSAGTIFHKGESENISDIIIGTFTKSMCVKRLTDDFSVFFFKLFESLYLTVQTELKRYDVVKY